MPIPDGTKFHGVAPEVDTVDRGSASVDCLREAYNGVTVWSNGTERIVIQAKAN